MQIKLISDQDVTRIRALLDCYQLAPSGPVAEGLLAEAAKILEWHQQSCDILAGATINDITEREHKPVVIPAGWTKVENGECPLDKGTLVDVLYRDGDEGYRLPAHEDVFGYSKNGLACSAECFASYGESGDIIAYRLHTPEVGQA